MSKTLIARCRQLSRRIAVVAMIALTSILASGAFASAADQYAWKDHGEFSYASMAMKRLSHCSIETWSKTGKVGGKITQCDNAANDPQWDRAPGTQFDLTGTRVGYQDGKCPSVPGGRYVKCFYLGGKGAPVMSVGYNSTTLDGGYFFVNWYYQ